jgi:hypothetical protein
VKLAFGQYKVEGILGVGGMLSGGKDAQKKEARKKGSKKKNQLRRGSRRRHTHRTFTRSTTSTQNILCPCPCQEPDVRPAWVVVESTIRVLHMVICWLSYHLTSAVKSYSTISQNGSSLDRPLGKDEHMGKGKRVTWVKHPSAGVQLV